MAAVIRRWASPVAASLSLHIAGAVVFVTLAATFMTSSPRVSLPEGGIDGVAALVHRDDGVATTPQADPAEPAEPTEAAPAEVVPAPTPEPALTTPAAELAAESAGEPDKHVVESSGTGAVGTEIDEPPAITEPVTVETRPTPEMEQLVLRAVGVAERIVATAPLTLERVENRIRAVLARAAAGVAVGPAPTPGADADVQQAAASGSPSAPARSGGGAGVSRGPSPAFGNVAPRYPERARREGKEGTVIVHVVIEVNGVVSSCELALTSGVEALDSEAISTVKMWRFTPAMTDGAPVRSEADVPVVFRLRP